MIGQGRTRPCPNSAISAPDRHVRYRSRGRPYIVHVACKGQKRTARRRRPAHAQNCASTKSLGSTGENEDLASARLGGGETSSAHRVTDAAAAKTLSLETEVNLSILTACTTVIIRPPGMTTVMSFLRAMLERAKEDFGGHSARKVITKWCGSCLPMLLRSHTFNLIRPTMESELRGAADQRV